MRPLGSTSVADIVKIQIFYPGQAIEARPSTSITGAPAIPFHFILDGGSWKSQHRTVARRSAVKMNALLSPQLPIFPHQHQNLHLSQRSRKFTLPLSPSTIFA